MKTINTISVLFFLLIAMACSSEGDTIMNDIDNGVAASSEKVAIFDFSFSGDVLQTKSSSTVANGNSPADIETSTEASISNCYIAAIDESGNVLASYFYEVLTQDGYLATVNEHMIIKVPATKQPGLRFFAVANLFENSKDKLLACKALSNIDKVLLEDESPNILVKTGISEVISAYSTSESLKDNKHSIEDCVCNNITIPVYQRAAAIELAEFNVIDSERNPVAASVKSLQLLWAKRVTYVKGEYSNSSPNDYYASSDLVSPNDVNGKHPSGEGPIYGTYDKIRFYAYDNSSSDYETALKINYIVNGVDYERTYAIKTPDKGNAVVGGNLYQLHVTISNVSEEVNFKIADWIPNTINVGEINGTKK